MNVVKRIIPYLKPYNSKILLAAFCLYVATPCSLFHPLVWKFVVDTVIGENKPGLLAPALILMVVVHVIGTTLSSVRNYVLGDVGQRFIYDLRNDVYQKLQRQSLGYFHDRRTGDLISRAMSDVDAVQQVVINGIDSVVNDILSFVYVAFIVCFIHPVVGGITLVPLVCVGFLIYKFNTRIKKLYKAVRSQLGDVTAKLQENLNGIMTIKAFARENRETEQFETMNRGYMVAGIKAMKARCIYFPTVFTIGFLSNVTMIGLGAVFVIFGENLPGGKLSLGGLVAYRGYWWQLFSPIRSIATVNDMFQRAIAAGDRIFELLDEEETIQDAPEAVELAEVQGDICFEHVTFSYDGKTPTLGDIAFHVQPGHNIGVVGPSGGGKSTLLNLMMRFYDPQQGKILLDGHDLRTVTQRSLRQHIGVVTQEAFLFHQTVRYNLLYGRPEATNEEIIEAAKQANAHDFIEDLPNGYDTQIGERGVKLSGGQRQRLCIARAFLANPKILLLDEATASVEPESELLIQSTLQKLMKGRTTIIVSHRLSMVRDADTILVVRHGGMAERGTHAELMAANGWYARMYSMQMEGAPLPGDAMLEADLT